MSRLGKQFIYGALFLSFAAAAAGVAYLLFLPDQSCINNRHDWGEAGVDCGGPCARACIPADIRPLQAGDSRVFQSGDAAAVLFEIQNPNQNHAARSFRYEADLFDAEGNSVGSIKGESFAYSGEIKRVAGFLPGARSRPIRADIRLAEPEWVPAAEFSKPDAVVLGHRTEAGARTIRTAGQAMNRDAGRLAEVRIVAVYRGAGGPVGVSETVLAGFEPGESRDFAVIHPAAAAVQPERTELYLSARRP